MHVVRRAKKKKLSRLWLGGGSYITTYTARQVGKLDRVPGSFLETRGTERREDASIGRVPLGDVEQCSFN